LTGLDVLVVGGGPAGLAAAIEARLQGLTVVVADRASQGPIDKPCGEGVLPDGVTALARWGIFPHPSIAFPFQGIRFIDCPSAIQAEAYFPTHPGLGIRRDVLHRLLLQRATELGVNMRWGAKVHDRGGQLHLGGERIAAGAIVAADGLNSRMRQWAGISARVQRRRLGFRQHFGLAPWTDLVEVYWHRRGQAYVTPVAPRTICIAVVADPPGLHINELAACFPALAARLARAPRLGALAAAATYTTHVGRVAGPKMALVGDASGAVDAISGAGLSLAFAQARVLGPALSQGELATYQRHHRRLNTPARRMARLLLLMGDHGWLRRRVLAVLASNPAIMTRLLADHAERQPRGTIDLVAMAALGWRLLTAAPGSPGLSVSN